MMTNQRKQLIQARDVLEQQLIRQQQQVAQHAHSLLMWYQLHRTQCVVGVCALVAGLVFLSQRVVACQPKPVARQALAPRPSRCAKVSRFLVDFLLEPKVIGAVLTMMKTSSKQSAR